MGAQFAGEQLLRWLGVISGLLVAAIGVGLLVSALRTRRERAAAVQAELVLVGMGGAGGTDAAAPTAHGHGHGQKDPGYSRRGLVGMGIAGGLVPSPSATVVLAGSIALGRTVFGIGLVLAYGLGMAATLTAVGLLLVRVRHRLDAAAGDGPGRIARLGARVETLTAVLPVITAVLVLVVGLFLATRGILTHCASDPPHPLRLRPTPPTAPQTHPTHPGGPAVPLPAPTARLLAALLVCCGAVGCSSSGDAPARFSADGAKKLSCMQHQSVAPGPDYTDSQRADLGRNLTVFKYYVLNGAAKYCDGKGPNAQDRAWAQFVAKETGNRASVAAILDAPTS